MAISKKTNTRFGVVSEDDMFIFNEDRFIDPGDESLLAIINVKKLLRYNINEMKEKYVKRGIEVNEIFKIRWAWSDGLQFSYNLIFAETPSHIFTEAHPYSLWSGEFYGKKAILELLERVGYRTELPIRNKAKCNRRW